MGQGIRPVGGLFSLGFRQLGRRRQQLAIQWEFQVSALSGLVARITSLRSSGFQDK